MPADISFRAALLATTSPAALWCDITPETVDNLTLFGSDVRRNRSTGMQRPSLALARAS